MKIKTKNFKIGLRTKRAAFLLALFFVTMSAGVLFADTNIVWEFTNSAAYDHTHPFYTEVDGTNAQLIQQAKTILQHDYASYTNNTSGIFVEFGPDEALSMSGSPGSFPASASYISRIFDSGGSGNEWRVLMGRFANARFARSIATPQISSGGLAGWWRMDNDWLDSSGSVNHGAGYGDATFSSTSVLGFACGLFDGNGDHMETSGAFPSGDKASISIWVYPGAATFSQLINYVVTADDGGNGSFNLLFNGGWNDAQYGVASNSISLYINSFWESNSCSEGGTFTLDDADKWHHIVVTYDNLATPKTHIYKNGLELRMYSSQASGSIGASTAIRVGNRSDGSFDYEGRVDDLLVYNRVLTHTEVLSLFHLRDALHFRTRSSDDVGLLSANAFVGPDGTTNSVYIGRGDLLESGGGFDVNHQYMQYKADFYTDVLLQQTPSLTGVALSRDNETVFDNYRGEFMQGSYSGVTNTLPVTAGAFLGIAKKVNGGYYTNATYESRVLDATNVVSWEEIQWPLEDENEIPSSLDGLVALHHFNGGLSRDFYGGNRISSWAGGFIKDAKLGSDSIVFNGTNQFVRYQFTNATLPLVQSVQFWMNSSAPDGGIFELHTSDTNVSDTLVVDVCLTNRLLVIEKLKKTGSIIYVNGNSLQKRLIPGWNLVGIDFGYSIPCTNYVVGRAGASFLEGTMDELVLLDRELYKSELDDHYVKVGRNVAGMVVRAEARSGDTLPLGMPFSGDYGNDDSLVRTNRYLQYKLVLAGDGGGTPAIESVTVNYDTSSFVDDTGDEFVQGNFGGDTAWYGNNIELDNLGGVGPLPIRNGAAEAIWHMDEQVWTSSVACVRDATSISGYHGTPDFGAATVPQAAVGFACGRFDGVDDQLDLKSIPLTGDFTLNLWFKTTDTNRSALLSSQNGTDWCAIEINGDGAVQDIGKLTFVVQDTGNQKLIADWSDLNDGVWHNVVCQRSAGQLHVYIDGERAGSLATTGNNNVGGGIYAACTPAPNMHYNGYIDEVAVWQSALSEADIGNIFSGGFQTSGQGEYVSRILQNGGEPSIWRTLAWTPDAPYGNELTAGPVSLMALWHFNGSYLDEVGPIAGSATAAFDASGRFAQCLSLSGTTVSVGASPDFNPAEITLEMWVRMNGDVASRIIFDKHNLGSGYILETDANGNPKFTVEDVSVTGYVPVRAGKWTHLAGTYDGNKLRLFVDGDIAASLAVGSKSPSSPLVIASIGGAGYTGLIDELAIHSRALKPVEILDHYKAGALTLKFQAQTDVQSFVGPGKSTTEYYTDSAGCDMQSDVELGVDFRYRAVFGTEDYKYTPRLHGVSVYVANYPTTHPQVYPTNGIYTPGRLLGFTQTIDRLPIANDANAMAKYQVSWNDGDNYYYWHDTSNVWAVAGVGDYNDTSDAGTINSNIWRMYDQFAEPNKSGIDLKVKTFFHSDGAYQIKVDTITVPACEGRIIVTFPDGAEQGVNALAAGVPQTITWSSDGNVSSNIQIELFKDSGLTSLGYLGAGVPKTNSYLAPMPTDPLNTYRIKITDLDDTNIWDWADGDFELVKDFRMISPNGSEYWKLGDTTNIVWDAHSPGSDWVALYFSNNGGADWFQFTNNIASVPGARNAWAWDIPTDNPEFVSENALIGVNPEEYSTEPSGASFYDISDGPFTNAGIVVTLPALGDGVDVDTVVTCAWKSAAAGDLVDIEFYNGLGVTQTWASGVANVSGWNAYDANLPGGTAPSAGAWFRIVSTNNLEGYSGLFNLAAIKFVSPTGNVSDVINREHWVVDSTHDIIWRATDAGAEVDIKFSVDGGPYQAIKDNFIQTSDDGQSNNVYSGWVIPGPPSHDVKVQVSSSAGSLNKESEVFDFFGVLINEPTGSTVWNFAQTNWMSWLAEPEGNLDIEIAYVENPTDGAFEAMFPNKYTDATNNFLTVPISKVRRPTEFATIRAVMTNTYTGLIMVNTSPVFQVKGLSLTVPTNGAVYTLGTKIPQALRWFSAGTEDNDAEIALSLNSGSTYPYSLTTSIASNNVDGSEMTPEWTPSRTLLPSDTAMLYIEAGTNSAESAEFVLRGIRVTRPVSTPVATNIFDLGTSEAIRWVHAGLDSGARVALHYSPDGTNLPFAVTPGLPDNLGKNATIDWAIDADLDPTTNGMIRVTVFEPVQDTDVIMYSDPFTLRGVKIKSPAVGTNWALGSAVKIKYLAAGFSTEEARIYYAHNGIDYDTGNPIAINVPVSNAMNEVVWNIESSFDLIRTPSTNARIKVEIPGQPDEISDAFAVSGIKIMKPDKNSVLAVSDTTAGIRWFDVNAGPPYTLWYTDWEVGPALNFITNGINATNYTWTIPTNPPPAPPVSTNLTLTIAGGGYTGYSERFQMVLAPNVQFSSPTDGEYWKVSDVNRIKFQRGGVVSNDFVLTYWTDPFATTNPALKTGAFNFLVDENSFYYDWTVRNNLGQTRLIVTNVQMTTVGDTFENFRVVPKFEGISMSGARYARKSVSVSWTNKGDVGSVDFYYTTDMSRGTTNWVKVNTSPSPWDNGAPLTHNSAPVFFWDLPDTGTNYTQMYLRIQDSAYTTMFPAEDLAGNPYIGPFDDYGPFDVRYYKVFWEVYDGDIFDYTYNSNNLADSTLKSLSMSDNLGVSIAGIPIAGWSDPDTRAPYIRYYPHGEWDTLWFKEFFHDQALLDWVPSENLTNTVVMERSQIEPNYNVMANFTYDDNTTKFLMHSWLERGGAITEGATNCTIRIFDGEGNWITNRVKTTADNGIFWQDWDIAGLGYTPSDVFFAKVYITYSGVEYSSGLTFLMRRAAVAEEIGEVIAVKSEFTFSSATTNFAIYSWLERAGAILPTSSNCVVTITDTGSGTNFPFLTAGSDVDGVYNLNWLVPDGFNESDVFFGRTEIDYLGKTYSAGQTFMMRLAATDAITNMMGDVQAILGGMGTVTSGIAAIKGDIGGMSNRLDTAITTAKDDVIRAVATNTAVLGTISSDISTITGEVVGVIGPAVTSIWNEVADMSTNAAAAGARILTRPTTVQNGETIKILYKTRPNMVGSVKMSISAPSTHDDVAMKHIVAGSSIYYDDVTFSWGAGTYVVSCSDPYGEDSMVLECVLTGADESLGMIAGMSNMLDSVASDVAALSGLGALTNSMAALQSVVTNLAGLDTTTIVTGLNNIETKLTALKSDVATIDTSSLESSVSEVKSGMGEIKSAVAAIDTSQLDQIAALANQLGQIGSDSTSAAQNSQQAKTAAQEAADGIQALKDALAVDDVDQASEAINAIRKALVDANKSIAALSELSIGGNMNDMLDMLKKLARSKGLEGLAKATDQTIVKPGEDVDIDSLTQTLEETKIKMIHMEKLLEESAYEPVITSELIGEK